MSLLTDKAKEKILAGTLGLCRDEMWTVEAGELVISLVNRDGEPMVGYLRAHYPSDEWEYLRAYLLGRGSIPASEILRSTTVT